VRDKKEFELHPNTAGEGRAALSFVPIDLSHSTKFACTLRLPGQDAHPVRIRVDVIPPERADCYAAEKILQPGDICQWEFAIPATVSTTCTVLFGVDLVDPRDSAEGAHVMIADARFE
jgi:hypothetical protein